MLGPDRWKAALLLLPALGAQVGCELIAGIHERPLARPDGGAGGGAGSSSTGTGASSTGASSTGASASSTGTGASAVCPTSCTGASVDPDYPSAVLADAPVGYWRFEESAGALIAVDETHHNDGKVDPAVTFQQPGAMKGSLGARVAGGGVRMVPFDAYDFGAGSFTAELWIQPSVVDDQYRFLMGKGATFGPNFAAYLHDFAGDGPTLQFERRSASQALLSLVKVPAPAIGVYTHVVIRYDAGAGAAMVLYNGAMMDVAPLDSGDCSSPSYRFSWGHLSEPDSGNPLMALLDEAALYDHPLSCERICAHFLAATGP